MILEGTALLIAAGVMVASTAATAVVSNENARKARNQASDAQARNLQAAAEAANRSTGATTSNVGEVALQSTEDLQDESIRNKATKNRLRVDTTGISLNNSTNATPMQVTGLRI